MALSVTARGTAASNASSSTTYAFSPASNCTAGKTLVLVISADNSASAGSSNNIDSVTDSLGNVWTKRNSALFDNGAASAGIQGAIFDTTQGAGTLTTGATITVTFGANTTAKSYALWELGSAAGTNAAHQTNSTQAGATTASPTYTTVASITNGDCVVFGIAGEAGTTQTHTADADTTNGSWSSAQYSEVGSTTSGNIIASQCKVVSATATQTYNPTFGLSQDSIVFYAVYRETSNVQSLTLGLLDGAPTLYAPTLTQPWSPSNSYETEISADNPVFLVPATETSGNITDVIGGKVGTKNGTAITYAVGTGPAGLAGIRFDVGNASSYFSFADHADLDLGDGDWTIEVWWTRATLTRHGSAIFTKGSNAAIGIIDDLAADSLEIYARGVGLAAHATSGLPHDTTIHHLAFTKTTTGDNWKVYIDGSDATTVDGNPSTADTASAFVIGVDNGGALGSYAEGVFQYFAIYKSALSSTRIAAHYTAGQGAAAQTLTLGLLDGAPTLYAPTLAPGPVGITLGLLDGSPTLYAPTITPKNTVTLGLLDAGPALYAPTVAPAPYPITLGLLDAGPTLYAPTVKPTNTLTLGLLDAGPALYAPTIVAGPAAISLPLLDAGPALYAPTVVPGPVGVTLPLLDASPALYAPTVKPTNTVTLGLLDGAPTLYAPTLVGKNTLTLPLLDAGPALYAPTVAQSSGAQALTLPLLDGGPALYSPMVANASAPAYYGPGVGMDTLWNDLIGGAAARSVSYRFRAQYSDYLDSVRVYIIANGNTGYSNGTGGTIRVRLFADDGTANHYPTGSALASGSVTPGNPAADAFPDIAFTTPYFVNSNTLYHLVFDNTDGSPTVNYCSLDGMGLENTVQEPRSPRWPLNLDWWQGYNDGGAGWNSRSNIQPIADLTYDSGVHQGAGWMEISYGTGEVGEINGTSKMVREIFTVSGGSKTVVGVGVRFWRVSGTGDVSIRLEDSGGTEIETVIIPSTSFPTEANPSEGGVEGTTGQGGYAYALFTSPHVLSDATAYRVRFSTDSSTTLRTTVIRKGTSQGFHASTVFESGSTNRSEKTTDGSSWSSLGRVSNVNDVQFYFTLATAASTQSLVLPYLDASPTLYAPTIGRTNTLVLGLLDAGPALYAPTVAQASGTQALTLSLLDAGPALYAPTVAPAPYPLTLPLLDGAPALYAPTLQPVVTIQIGLLDAGPALYAPSFTVGAVTVTLPLLDALRALYAPTIAAVTYAIAGVTRDQVGAILGSCVVHLFRTSDDVEIAQATSAADGSFSFPVPDNTTSYYIVAYKVGSPDRAGTTVNTLVGS
jgi:hypothetical protein